MNSHLAGWKLEMYVTGRLGAPNSPSVIHTEEHLLQCEECIAYAERLAESLVATRDAGLVAVG